MIYTHGGGQTETKAQYIANVTKGPSHYQSMTEREVRLRFFGKTAVLWGLVDVQPATGELYRVRTLEVYTQNNSGTWQMAQKESMSADEIGSSSSWALNRRTIAPAWITSTHRRGFRLFLQTTPQA